MGKTVTYTLTDETLYRPTAAEWQRIDERAEQGGDAYYTDLPEPDDDFWTSDDVVYPPKKEPISIRLNPRTVAYFRQQGRGYQTRISDLLDAYVALREAEQRGRA